MYISLYNAHVDYPHSINNVWENNMPRKKIITRRIRRLKPSEIDYIIRGVVAYDAELESDSDHFVNESRKAQKVARDLRGRYKDLAIIVEEE